MQKVKGAVGEGTDEVGAGNTAGAGHFLTFLVDQTTRDILKRKSLLSEDWLSQAQARTWVKTDKGYGKIKITHKWHACYQTSGLHLT